MPGQPSNPNPAPDPVSDSVSDSDLAPADQTPKTPARWVVTAFLILLALALIVVGSSIWILHRS